MLLTHRARIFYLSIFCLCAYVYLNNRVGDSTRPTAAHKSVKVRVFERQRRQVQCLRDGPDNSVCTTFSEGNDDIYTTTARFNQHIATELQRGANRMPVAPFCDVIQEWSTLQQRQVVVPRAFVTFKQLLQLPLLGSSSWIQTHENVTLTLQKQFLAAPNSLIKNKLTNSLLFYNSRSFIAGVQKFVLSSKASHDSRLTSYRSHIRDYFACHASVRLNETGGWPIHARNVLPSICNQRCTTDLAVFNRSLPIPDYALHTDFYQVLYASACQNRNRTSLFPSIVNDYALHNNLTGDVLMSLYVVQEGGVVFNSHGVLTRSLTFFQAYGCASTPQFYTNFPNAFRNILRTVNNLKCLDSVFVIARQPQFNFYHYVVEHITRLAGYIDFLRERPKMPIHVLEKTESLARKYLPLYGLSNPVVSGHVTANRIYVPQGGGCHDQNLASVQLASSHYRRYIEHFTRDFQERMRAMHSSKPIILLVKRKLRRIINHVDLHFLAKQIADVKEYYLYVYDENQLPGLNETMWLFHHARLIIGAHGAGLSNILFSQPGTTIVEIHCHKSNYVRMTFRQLALKLGMRYHGTMSVYTGKTSPRCAKEGLLVDIDAIGKLFTHLTRHVL